jgi:NDP-sugar pyrophosphorylase family protein
MAAMFRAEDLLDLSHCPCPELFAEIEFVWEALPKLAGLARRKLKHARTGQIIGAPYIADDVSIGKGTVIEHGAVILGPTILGENCQVRANAYIRGNVIVGNECILGNACEFKHCVLFDNVQVPHFSYVGDSILGHQAHLGAGAILSNVKSLKGNVVVTHAGKRYDTGLRKFGAVLGDGADIGSNCVLNPGSIIGRGAVLYPGVLWRGVCPPDNIVKLRQQQEIVERR